MTVTRRQMIKGLSIVIVGAASPVARVAVPNVRAAGTLTLPMGLGAALQLEHALQELAAMGGMVSMATFNAHIVTRTGIHLVTEGFAAEQLMVRVTTMGAGYAVSLVGMFNVAFFIGSAGLMGWVIIQGQRAPQVHELTMNFVPYDDWLAATGGDLTGLYIPGPPANLYQAWSDIQTYLYLNPQLCSGFNAKPGQGGCFGAFGGGPGGPFDSPVPPPGWIGVGPIIEVQ